MTIKTYDLYGSILDWAVAQAEGIELERSTSLWWAGPRKNELWRPSVDYAQGVPIMEREHISTRWVVERDGQQGCWSAYLPEGNGQVFYGSTMLVAGMRCRVGTTLGPEIDLPAALL